jgi:AAA15 family ATPase/GTPase
MVVEIRLSNFFSIKEEIVLDFLAQIARQQVRSFPANIFVCRKGVHLLKSVAIFGANASGKSNIIKAIQFSIQMILQSHLYNENDSD